METLRPELSILLPVRQWGEHSLAAINSILQQSLSGFELLIIGQHDLSQLHDQMPLDPRIRLIARTQPGIVGALNTGLEQSRGRFIARMDDDDIAYPHRLQSQRDYLREHPARVLCATRVRFVDTTGDVAGVALGNQRYQQWLNGLTQADELQLACYRECPMPHPTLMAHRSVWQELGGYRQLDAPEDYDLVLRAMLNGIQMGKPTPVLQDWREHKNRLTYRDPRYRREAFTNHAAWAAMQPDSGLALDTGRGIWLCGTGRQARFWHDALTRENGRVLGFVDISRNGPNRSKRQLPVIDYPQLAHRRANDLVISTVTQPEGRARICDYLNAQGWENGRDYLVGG